MKLYGPDVIGRAVDLPDLIEPVSRALADFSLGLGQAPLMVFAPAGEQGDVHVKAAWLPGRRYFTVKVGTWFAAGDPPSGGYIAVHDAATGLPYALLFDDHRLTDLRTAAAGAVATRLLARPDATTLAVLGTGVQARLQALAARAVRPVESVVVWGRSPRAALSLREALLGEFASVTVAPDPEQAVRQADVIVTATAARSPILRGAWLRPGQHVTAVGADDLTKAELDPACFHRADVLAVDSRRDTPAIAGDLNASGAEPTAEIGEIILGRHPGRVDERQLTVAKLIGLGVQDLAAAETTLPLLEEAPS
ncbi:ornithine cyclodeaminase family protein [Nonomuraea sediminis]|uniref:ornithine cyclodeaminase family protein n=1 Tax=Nonomuraea sediminis TaxID=2835864 RepID=UPI001BDC92B5|nr:ornithine cyclodeaminase family protein [Nonomuraea sediminis]